MSGNVLVIGGGGREHAIVWKLQQSDHVKTIFTAPGSHAIQQVAKCRNVVLNIADFKEVGTFCNNNDVELVIVGPEDPLANGITDALNKQGIQVFGPNKSAARIESDKEWAKAFMDRNGVPTAQWRAFQDATEAKNFIRNANFPALVIKASGLAAGKGVVVAGSQAEACRAVDEILTDKKFGDAGKTVVVEELLEGEEVSVLAFCDGDTVKAMLPAQDHKRIFDGDQGPNTGGMGAYCPCPLLSNDDLQFVQENVLQKTANGFKSENIKFVGVLYAGLMLTKAGPKVLEFNCRFGDPETEVLLPLLQSDLFQLMKSCCNNTLGHEILLWKPNLYTVGVVMASKGYPETSSKGQTIHNVDLVETRQNHIIFHCGTEFHSHFTTNGGRVLIVVVLAPDLVQAQTRATLACDLIQFEGKQYRRDISCKGIARSILKAGQLTYKQSGVDISSGNELVSRIKPLAKSTRRPGVLGTLGGFGGLFDPRNGYEDPILVSGTDGVGTKLKIAQATGKHSTIGVDLVAMCVNDILAHGAEPVFFLDYFATSKLDLHMAASVIGGIAEGCRLANCGLIGGETAEMPDIYSEGDYDLAGFAVGLVERQQVMPFIDRIIEGDLIVGLPSSGVHSNGFSLVRKILEVSQFSLDDSCPFSGKTLGEELLTPTRIYVKTVLPAIKTGKVKAFAHITGGGLVENIPRVLPDGLGVELDSETWEMPPIFPWLAVTGGVNEWEMLRTFNCGIGAVLVVSSEDKSQILNVLDEEKPQIIGKVVRKKTSLVVVENFTKTMENAMKPYVKTLINRKQVAKKRVAVLISGSGTNLQALINASENTEMNAEIVVVVSNKDKVEGLKRAEKAKIPTIVISHLNHKTREDFDREITRQLLNFNVDFVCLAGFMRLLSGEFTRFWKGRLINIHPSLLPAFKGMKAQKQALEAGVRVTGCTVHFVEEEMDSGLIITQEAVVIELNDTEESLTERIKVLAEHKAYPRALKLLATGKVKLEDNKLIWL